MRLENHQYVYVRSMGKALRVTAIFTNDDAANAYLKRHPDEGIVAQFGCVSFAANLYDKGVHISDP